LLRSFYDAGVELRVSDRSRREGSELAGIAEKINKCLAAGKKESKWYTQYVIKSLIYEQWTYHNNKIRSIGNNHHIFERINLFIGILFIVNLAAHLVHVFVVQEGPQEMSLYKFGIFFNILLPASYAAIEGMIYFNEWALLKKYCVTARNSLKEAEHLMPDKLEQLSAADSHKKQTQVLHLISSIMLTDNRNWNLLLENKDKYQLIV
jgi:hypothetical protein